MSRRAAGTALLLTLLCGLAQRSAAQTFELLPLTSTAWRFDDSASDLGTAWKEILFTGETNWRTGTAMFGVEPTVPYPYPAAVTTPMVLGANRLTYYFRSQFLLTNSPSTVVVQGTAYVDDGAVFYVNGQEVGRVRVPDQPVLYFSKAQVAFPEGQAYTWTLPSSALVVGSNVIAVEVHQNNSSSSDVVFGLKLQATVAVGPSLVDPSQPADRVVPQGQPTTLAVMGSGVPAPTYQWYHNNASVAGATGPSLHIPSFMAADGGQYYVVLANAVGVLTSRVAQVSFQADTNPPSILYAVGRNPNTVEVVFSEPPEPFGATDDVNWSLETADGTVVLDVINIIVRDGTNVVFTTMEARDPATSYAIRTLEVISDNYGNLMPIGTRVPIATFSTPLIALASQPWSYEISGADLGSGWTAPAFNDAAWPTGLGVLDSFRAQADSTSLCRVPPVLPVTMEDVRTCISISNAQNTAQLSAAYFRTHFQFAGTPTNSVLQLRALLDDGAVIYLNGVELSRLGLAAGPVLNATLANRTVPNPAWETIELTTSALIEGDNVLAIEVHQDSLTSPDLTLGIELTGVLPVAPPQQRADAAPRLQAGRAQGGLDLSWAPSIGRLQSASATSGPWVDVAALQPGRYQDPLSSTHKFFRVIVP